MKKDKELSCLGLRSWFISLLPLSLLALPGLPAVAEIIFSDDFENSSKAEFQARGWYDIAGWGTSLSTTTAQARTGTRSLRLDYTTGSTGGWMHINSPQDEPVVYVRYYRFFPADWQWPAGYGPHDTYLFGGSYNLPTYNDLVIYGDLWRTGETKLRVATNKQNDSNWNTILRKKAGMPGNEPGNYFDSLVIATEYIGTIEQNGNQPPQASFEHYHPWGSLQASFDASRSTDPDGTIAIYSWDFGDGSTGVGPNISHTYTPGDYSVTLTVTDNDGETHSQQYDIQIGAELGSGDGLQAVYYDGQQFSAPVFTTTEPQVNFQRQGWNGRFIRGQVGDSGGNNYSAHWSGFIQPGHSEEYTLSLDVRDGGKVLFNGQLVIDAWDGAQEKSANIGELVAGEKYPIEILMYHQGPDTGTDHYWHSKLSWQSNSVAKEIIPANQFYLSNSANTTLPAPTILTIKRR